MDKARIQGIFEKNLLEEKVQTDDSHVQVYTRNVRSNVKDPFTYKCNICQTNDIEGQQALFEHNKSANHIEKVTVLSHTHINERKITELEGVHTSTLEEFSNRTFDSASLSTVEKAIQTLDKVYHYYEKCPDKHPSYQNDWAKYYQNRKKELLAEFRNVETYDFTDEWTIHWDALRKEYYRKNVAECIDYIVENYTMNNNIDSTPRSTSTVVPSLESGELRESPPKRKKSRRRRSKKKRSKKRSKSRRSRSVSTKRSITPSDRSSSSFERRRSSKRSLTRSPDSRRQSRSPDSRRHRPSRRSRSLSHRRSLSRRRSRSVSRRRSSPNSSDRRSSSIERRWRRRRRRSRSRSKSPAARRAWSRGRSKARWTSPRHYTVGRSRSLSRSRSRSLFVERFRSRRWSPNGARTPGDLRFSIEKRRQQRDRSESVIAGRHQSRDRSPSRINRSPKFSPIISSDHSSSIDRHQARKSRSKSPTVKRYLPENRLATSEKRPIKPKVKTIGHIDLSDSGTFSSDAPTPRPAAENVPAPKWTPVPPASPATSASDAPTPRPVTEDVPATVNVATTKWKPVPPASPATIASDASTPRPATKDVATTKWKPVPPASPAATVSCWPNNSESKDRSVDGPAAKPTTEKLGPPKPTPSNPVKPIKPISSDSVPPKPIPSMPGQIISRRDSLAQNRPKAVAPVPPKPVSSMPGQIISRRDSLAQNRPKAVAPVPPKPVPSVPGQIISRRDSLAQNRPKAVAPVPPKPVPSMPGQITSRRDSLAQNRPKTVASVPLIPAPLPVPSPSPSTSAIPAIPPIKSILKKSSASKETAFARATRMLSSSNSDMQKFYNKIELKLVADASKRVLKFLSSFKSGGYPEYIRLDITLLSTQVRNMLESISIDPSTLSDDEVQTLTSNYMSTMGNDRVIVKQQTPVAVAKVNKDAAPVASPKPLNEALNGMNRSTSASKNVPPPMASAPPPTQTRSRIDRTTLLNDIDVAKPPVQKPSTTFIHAPNPRDPRLRLNGQKKQKIDCLDVVDMEIEPKPDCLEVVDMELDKSGNTTEAESDDDCQIVATYTLDKIN